MGERERDRALDPSQTRARDTLFKLATAWRSSAASGPAPASDHQPHTLAIAPDACAQDSDRHLALSHHERRLRQPL
jgi:hypothetical protein